MSKRRTRRDGQLDWFAWSPRDFNAKTTHLDRRVRHAYRDLLDHAFLQGRHQMDLPDDDNYLAAVVGVTPDEWRGMRFLLIDGPLPLLAKTDDGWLRNRRLAEEVAVARQKSGKAAASVRARYEHDANVGSEVADGKESEKEPEKAAPPTLPDFAAAARLDHKLANCGLKVAPPQQIVTAWVGEYGEELINETLADCETQYRGKHYRYLEAILTGRKENSNERPGNRRRTDGRRPAREAAEPKADAPVFAPKFKPNFTLDEVLAAAKAK